MGNYGFKKGAYGLVDGLRLFYLKMKSELEGIGMKELSGAPAVFTKHSDDLYLYLYW